MFDKVSALLNQYKRLWPLALAVAVGIWLFSDAGAMVSIERLSTIALILGFFHWARKSLFPYLDLKAFVEKALTDPRAAAVIVASVLGFVVALCWVAVSHAAAQEEMLLRAKPRLHEFKSAVHQYWPEAPCQVIFPSWVEQESGWKAKAELKTRREYGFGYSQTTVAYNADGSVRFNRFLEAKKQYDALSGWTWDNRYEPRYHFVFMTLEAKRLFMTMRSYFDTDENRWAAALVSYNAGPGTVLSRRAFCSRVKGCDTSRWFGGLDQVRTSGETRLLYGRPLWERRNDYPRNIIHVRATKYAVSWRDA